MNLADAFINTKDLMYSVIFGRILSIHAIRFSSSFLSVGLKLFCAKAIVMICIILIGNILGPFRYGSMTLTLSIGNILCLPFFTCWGLAHVKFASEDSQNSTENHLRAPLFVSLLMVCIFLPILLTFNKQLACFLNISQEVWIWGCILGILMGAYYFSKIVFQADRKWRSYTFSEFLFAGSLMVGLMILWLMDTAHELLPVLAVFMAAHLMGMVPAGPILYRALGVPAKNELVLILSYGFGLMISFGLSLLALQLDKLFLNYYGILSDVGRYQAYYLSTFGLVGSISVILNNYLLPLYGRYDHHNIKPVLMRFLTVISLPIWAACLICGRLAFFLFGKSFVFGWMELIWGATFTVVIFALQTMVFFSMTLGKRAVFYNCVAYGIFIVNECILMPILIPKYGVIGAFQSMTLSSILAIVFVYWVIYTSISIREGCMNEDRIR
jgi:O-antigen/teichoic acid export membrane protein